MHIYVKGLKIFKNMHTNILSLNSLGYDSNPTTFWCTQKKKHTNAWTSEPYLQVIY